MAAMLLNLSQPLLMLILPAAQAMGLSLEEFLDHAARAFLAAANPSATVDELLQVALTEAEAIEPGNHFSLDELLAPPVWAALSTGDRKHLGKMFRKHIEEKYIGLYIARTTTGKALYSRHTPATAAGAKESDRLAKL
jgi:hypothetical protein